MFVLRVLQWNYISDALEEELWIKESSTQEKERQKKKKKSRCSYLRRGLSLGEMRHGLTKFHLSSCSESSWDDTMAHEKQGEETDE